jgi:hypothetical protein
VIFPTVEWYSNTDFLLPNHLPPNSSTLSRTNRCKPALSSTRRLVARSSCQFGLLNCWQYLCFPPCQARQILIRVVSQLMVSSASRRPRAYRVYGALEVSATLRTAAPEAYSTLLCCGRQGSCFPHLPVNRPAVLRMWSAWGTASVRISRPTGLYHGSVALRENGG